MTRYANLKRNEQIVALFIQGVPPKQIRRDLLATFPSITSVWIVYKVVAKMFHREPKRQISPNHSIGKKESTA